MEKRCKDCGEIKDLSLFYKHKRMADGHLNTCISCQQIYEKNRRINFPELYSKYEATRKDLPHRKQLNLKIGKRYIKRNPLRYKATNLINNALRDGKISKLPCFVCGSEKVVAHHVAYDLPFDVVWLCQKHHKHIHTNFPDIPV